MRMMAALRRGAARPLGAACLAIALALPQAAASETLADVLIQAYRNSNLIDQNRAVLRAADEDVAQAVAILRPVIAAVASGEYIKSPFGTDTSGSLGMTMSLNLFDFGRGAAAIAAKKFNVLATRFLLLATEQNVLLNAVQAYVNVRQSQDAVRLSESNVRLIGQELKAAQDRFDVGETTRTDVAIADAQLAAARSNLAASQGQLSIARETFRLAVGAYPVNLAPLPKSPRIPKRLEEARAIALRTNPAILQAQQQVSAADAGIAQANANFRPQFNGLLSATDGESRNNRDAASFSLTLSQTLYSGGRRSSFYRQALALRDQSRANLHQQSLIVAQAVGQAWAQLLTANAQLQSSDEQIRSARIAFEGVREEAKLGARTTLDVLVAEQTLLQAQVTRLSAEAQRYFQVYNVLSTMGLLTVDHLGLGIPTYDVSAYYDAVKGAPVTSPQGAKLDRILKAIGKK